MKNPNKKLPEQSKSKNSDVKTMKGDSKTSSFTGSVENSKANGVRVSTDGSEDLAGDNLEGGVLAIVKTKIVETEIEARDEGYNENVHDTDHDGGNEMDGDSIGASDGISLLVDVSREMARQDSNDFHERENGGSLNGKSGNPDGKIREMIDREDVEEENSSNGKYEFCVGDFVWGKIKSYPWWPGQVYNSSDASDYALKVKRRDRILVAYFDGTFAWCHPSQLKHFEKNFKELSKQSSSKNFDTAVQKAVDEIGRLVELKITCSCVPKGSLVGLARPLAMNSGIKPGVLVPEDGIAKLWNYLFAPAECLTLLKHAAQVTSINNRLEFTELKCWLSAFYRVNRGHRLAVYHDPQPIPSLEDNSQNWVLDSSCDAAVPIQGSVEEEINQSLTQNCVGDSENGQYQRRKQKSIAEIMEGYVDPQVKNVEDVMKEGAGSAYSAPPSWRKKRKGYDEVIGGNSSSSKPKSRKVVKLLESTLATGSEIPSIERDSSRAKEEIKEVLLSREKKNKGSRIENDTRGKEEAKASPVSIERKTVQTDGGGAKEQTEKGILSREKKKSKYLSPPFTSINKRQSKRGIEAEFLKGPSESQLGEQMTRDAVNVVRSDSRPILMCSDEVPRKKDAKDIGPYHEKSNNSSPERLKLDLSATIDTMKVKVFPNEMLSGIRSVAIDLNSLEKNNSLDVVEGFLSVFRNSVYCNGSNYKIYNKMQPGRKKKIQDSEPGSLAKDQSQTDQKSPEQRSRQTKVRKTGEAKMKDDSEKLDKPILKQARQTPDMKTKDREADGKEKADKPKLKPAARAPDTKTKDRDTDGKGKPDEPKLKPTARPQHQKRKDKETDGKAEPVIIADDMETEGKASPPSLFVTFGPGCSLPSKNDIIKIYSKFGSLNEEETEMFYKNFCARVVFLSGSDAEAAFTSSQLVSPFRDSNANFQLRNCSFTSKVRKLKETSNAKPFSTKEGGKTLERESATKSSVGEASPFNYMKEKLKMIAFVLENSDGKMSPELKSKLEGEVKDLLELVKKVVGSSST